MSTKGRQHQLRATGAALLLQYSIVEWGSTLSAGRKILVAAKAAHYRQPQSFGDMVLTDRGLTTGVISTPEIAQFALGDFVFNDYSPLYVLFGGCQVIYRQSLVGHLENFFVSITSTPISSLILDKVCLPEFTGF